MRENKICIPAVSVIEFYPFYTLTVHSAIKKNRPTYFHEKDE